MRERGQRRRWMEKKGKQASLRLGTEGCEGETETSQYETFDGANASLRMGLVSRGYRLLE